MSEKKLVNYKPEYCVLVKPSVKETAKAIGVSGATIRQWAKDNWRFRGCLLLAAEREKLRVDEINVRELLNKPRMMKEYKRWDVVRDPNSGKLGIKPYIPKKRTSKRPGEGSPS
jgi:hypothetical protein